jgi:2-oxoglutarate ferredoxin oxidoreductase subunit delta
METIKKTRKVAGKVEIDIEKCKGCELCTTACKEGVLFLSKGLNFKGYRYILANNDLCTGCVNCALVCPDGVITVYRTNPKKKNIAPRPEENVLLTHIIQNPAYGDLSNMEYE